VTAEHQLRDAHAQLMRSARKAGMAEVATGVLHNVGNILNSVNTSCSLLESSLRGSRLGMLGQAVSMLVPRADDLPTYFAEDIRGRELPKYLVALAEHLEQERAEFSAEVQGIRKNIEHIKEIVRVQQKHATGSVDPERFTVDAIVKDAIGVVQNAFVKAGVGIETELAPLPPCWLRKHEVMQLLVNLLQNALQATMAAEVSEPLVRIRAERLSEDMAKIEVSDNGVGIAAETMPQLFRFGFTTRRDGHGFGLHSAANSARGMGGILSVESAGLGKGATFVFQFPFQARML
jgi:signal transduction histidine kinase